MKLTIHEIKPGMVLEQAVISPATGQCLLSSGTTLSIKNIEKMKELKIEEALIADRYSVFVSPEDKMSETLVRDYTEILRKICPKRPEANMNDEVVQVANHLEILIRKISGISGIMPSLVELKLTDNQHLYKHSLYTAVLSGIVAGCMKLSNEDMVATIVGALLHNTGMCEMPMLIGKEELTGQQRELYEQHPIYGYYFAVQKNIPRSIADCIQYHHEKWNGSGYPKGISGNDIPITARIVGMCASYSADITYKSIPRYMAVEKIYGTSGVYYDPDVVNAFIRNIPIYPLGEMVRLSTKEAGIVSNIRKNEGPRPVVKIYYNRVNRPISEDKIVDLGKERTIFIEEDFT